jgi:formylglycine-generating enzyme required for sulfatase activity
MSSVIEEISQPAEPLFRELIAPFDQFPDDFGALKQEVRAILIAATPFHALLQIRRVLEWVMWDVYSRRFAEPPNQMNLNTMIDQLQKFDQIPKLILPKITYVRTLGNVGGHPVIPQPGETPPAVDKEEVRSSITLLVPILTWYTKASQSGDLDRPPVARDDKKSKVSTDVCLAIVPKGLHSFDEGDSDYFLKLLPGPFHADDLPESIHFWKHRIESEPTFTVGVIWGRSGCGKSSLLKAGLLPRLDKNVRTVYVTATADDTEKNLLEGLRNEFPELPRDLDLKQAIEALRGRARFGEKKKVLLGDNQKAFLVLDQFEQWLHARRGEKETELVRALRQCDGRRVQGVVLVRDDFQESINGFMLQLNRPLDPENNRLVDLFEVAHARQVLAAFGRAYGKLGENLTPEQESFLDEAIAGLSQGHKVICVRLALFAQMFEHKEWTPSTLKEVGGTEGVGATFLEETFCSPNAHKQYSNHKDGAIAILKALLPEEGTEIKGRKRSTDELLVASGYQNRPDEFSGLLRSLDSDLRLITPTSEDQTGRDAGGNAGSPEVVPGTRYYQLTHDYLVPSLRKWLTRKLQETRHGRASLLLDVRASHWYNSLHGGRRDDRHMPSPREYLVIRVLTNPREWNDVQRSMMHHARNVYLRGTVVSLVVFAVLGLVGLGFWSRRHVEEMVGTLASAHISEVPKAVHRLSPYRRWADPLLRDLLAAKPEPGNTAEAAERRMEVERRKLNAALALLPVDPGQLGFLRDRLLALDETDLDAFPTLCAQLSGHRGELVEPFWQVLEDTSKPRLNRFRAAQALAEYTRQDGAATASRWAKSAPFVADEMVKTIVDYPGDFKSVLNILEPARRHLVGPLSAAFQDPVRLYHTLYAAILAEYAADQPERLASLVVAAREPKAFQKLHESLSKAKSAADLLERLLDVPSPGPPSDAAARKSNAVVALLGLKRPDRVWPLLKPAQDPRVRSFVIDRLSWLSAVPHNSSLEVALSLIVDHLEYLSPEDDDGTRQALILTLGELRKRMLEGDFNQFLPEPRRRSILLHLENDYREAADPGVRGAAEWLLRAWGQGHRLARIDESLKRPDRDRHREPSGQRWFVNAEGQTMVVVPRASSFKIGSRKEEPADNDGKREPLRDVTIDYSFAIGAHEVTFEEFKRSHPRDYQEAVEFLKPECELEVRCPINNVRWYEAAEYCNWLSLQDGIPEDQWCYQPNSKSKYASGMRISARFTALAGYRLPTEAEWEYACRAGTITSRYYGEADELLVKYVRFGENSQAVNCGEPGGGSQKMLWPVGSLKPNPLGLFDMLGNALEWCQDAYHQDPTTVAPNDAIVTDDQIRVMRGEKMMSLSQNIRAARRETRKHPDVRDYICGFRVARTYRP